MMQSAYKPKKAENRVKFGLRNVHIAVETEEHEVWDTPFSFPGAVNMSIEPIGDTASFYADDMIYYQSVANQGQSMEVEIARMTEEFESKVLGVEVDETTGIMVEKRDAKFKRFCMAFEIEGDAYNRKHWVYGVTAGRPTTEAATTEETIEPQTDTLTFTVAGLDDGTIGIKTGADTPDAVHEKWFEKVITEKDFGTLIGG